MTATLVIHEPKADVVYNYKDIKELGARLVEIFQASDHPTGVTMIVANPDNNSEVTVRVGYEHRPN